MKTPVSAISVLGALVVLFVIYPFRFRIIMVMLSRLDIHGLVELFGGLDIWDDRISLFCSMFG